MNTVGEPYSGKPNVRIDEGRPGEAVPNRAAYSTTDPLGAPVRVLAPDGRDQLADLGVQRGCPEAGSVYWKAMTRSGPVRVALPGCAQPTDRLNGPVLPPWLHPASLAHCAAAPSASTRRPAAGLPRVPPCPQSCGRPGQSAARPAPAGSAQCSDAGEGGGQWRRR